MPDPAALPSLEREVLELRARIATLEAASATTADLLPQALQAAPIGTVIASREPGGPVYHVNDAFTTITGYSYADVPTIAAWDERAYPDPAYRAWVQADRVRVTATTDAVYRIHCADGSEKDILFNRGGLPDNRMIVTLRNMGEHARILRELRESEERMRRLSDTIPVGIVVHSQGRIMYANQAAARMAGSDNPADLIDRDVFSFVHPASLAITRERIATLYRKDHDVGWIEFLFARADVSPFAVEVAASRVDWMGQPAGLVLFTDIQTRKEAEAARRRLERRMEDAQRMESLALLAGGVAHDFNNLLVGILGNADLALLELPRESPARTRVEGIELAARRAADLARQMLAYSGKGRFVVDRLDLNVLIREVTHLLESSVSKKAALQSHLAPCLPPIQADATQMRQVLMNLVTNASEALEDRPGTIRVSTGVMDADAGYLNALPSPWGVRGTSETAPAPPGRYVWLEVTDTGCGMDETTRARIFEPFFTTKFTGRGLGLAAVMGIVKGHGGAVQVYSEVGRGTTFKVLFPAMDGAADALTEEEIEEAVGPRRSGRILIVDDEPTVRHVCGEMLKVVGYEVATAADGPSAISLVTADPAAFDVILLDLSMPAMDGQETFTALRRIDPDLRVVLSSGYNEQEAVNRFAGKGLAGFVQKPYRLQDLVATLERARKP